MLLWPEPRHTFVDMIDRIRAFAALHPPEETLLYLVGCTEHGIDSNAPDYNPAPKCGGREGFARLLDAAHDQGYRVMIHTNVLAMAYSNPLYETFKQYQVVVEPARTETIERQELVSPGHYRQELKQELVSPGHFEYRVERVVIRPGFVTL